MLQLRKHGGKTKQTKGFSLREMLTRLSLPETDTGRNPPQSSLDVVSDAMADRGAAHDSSSPRVLDPTSGLLSQYFNPAAPAGPPQTAPGAWNANMDEAGVNSRDVDPAKSIAAQAEWEASRREDTARFISDFEQSSRAEAASVGAFQNHSPQYAEEILSGVARKITGRQQTSKTPRPNEWLADAPASLPPKLKYSNDFGPTEDQLEVEQASKRAPAFAADLRGRSGALIKRDDEEIAEPRSSVRRILLATGGGFVVALVAILALLSFNRSPSTMQENTRREPIVEARATVRDPDVKLSPGIASIEASARAAPTSPSVATASAFIPSVNSEPPSAPAVRRPSPRLRVDDISVPTGVSEVAFPIVLDAAGGAVESLKITVSDLPVAAKLNHGIRNADGSWKLRTEDLAGLLLTLPEATVTTQLTVSLTGGQGVQLARLNPTITIEPPTDLRQAVGKNDTEEKARGWFEKGEARLTSGDVIGARMFFKKAADAGDAQAANAMGATFDPNLFSSMQVQGMRPDVEMARQWYRRAMDLGSKDSVERLERLKSR